MGRSVIAADVYGAAAALVYGWYMLPAEAHERYLFPALALLAPLLPAGAWARRLCALLSATLLLNLLWVDPAVPLPWYAEQLGWGMPTALLNTAVGMAWVVKIVRGRPGVRPVAGGPAPGRC